MDSANLTSTPTPHTAPPYDYLIVGAGLYGATFAHQATRRGKRCLVIDRRTHLGGNLYCEDCDGIQVHRYGAHIFHTSDTDVWQYVNSLCPFNRFTNAPMAIYEGRVYSLPFNMLTFYALWGVKTPAEAQAKLAEQRAKYGVQSPQNLEEQALSLVGRDLYEILIKGYTEKQWGRPCTDLPPFIIRRLPVRFTYDNNYFNDAFQGIPIGGYNRLISAMLQGTTCLTQTDYLADRAYWDAQATQTIFTGAIDAFYNFCYGHLAYRTVHFEDEILPVDNAQGCAVINYTERSVPYTRCIEHKHFAPEAAAVSHTILSREYATEWRPGMEPYYPINDATNTALYQRYKALAALEGRVHFGGRLAEYKYYDMAPIVAQVLRWWQQYDTDN